MPKLNLTKAEVLARYAPMIRNHRGEDITERVFDAVVRDLAASNGTPVKKSAGPIDGETYESIRKAFTNTNSPVNSGLYSSAQIAYFDQTPLTNRMGRQQAPTPGKFAQIDTLVGIPTNPANPFGRTSAGKRGSEIVPKFLTAQFPMATIGMESNAADEIIAQGADYFDALAVSGMAAFYGSRRAEELSVLLSNYSVALAAPTGVTATTVTTGGTVPAASYNVYAVALTHEGYLMALANSPLALVSTTQTVTNVNGYAYSLNGGHGPKSAAAGTVTTTGATSIVRVSCNPVPNAHWYGWYVGTAGNEVLQGFSGQSSTTFAALTSGTQNASAIVDDRSRQVAGLAFDGLLSLTSSNSALGGAATPYSYDYQLPVVPGTNKASTLTNSNGQCVEINNMFSSFWQNWRTSPDLIIVSARENVSLNGIYTTTGSSNSPVLQYIVDTENNQIKAGLNVGAIMNVSANVLVPVMVHPDLMPGTIFGWTQDLSKFYQGTTVNQANQILWDKDWQQENFPRTERSQSTGCYANETLVNKFPGGLGKISNIGDPSQV